MGKHKTEAVVCRVVIEKCAAQDRNLFFYLHSRKTDSYTVGNWDSSWIYVCLFSQGFNALVCNGGLSKDKLQCEDPVSGSA